MSGKGGCSQICVFLCLSAVTYALTGQILMSSSKLGKKYSFMVAPALACLGRESGEITAPSGVNLMDL